MSWLRHWWDGVVAWWNTIDWGTAPEWLAAVGTIAAVSVALWQTNREGKRHREQERREAERLGQLEAAQRRAKVSGVVVEIEEEPLMPMALPDGTVTSANDHIVRIYNQSPAAIFGASFIASTGRQLAYIGTIRADDEGVAILNLTDLGAPPVAILNFYDVDSNEWTIDTDGNLEPFDPEMIEIKIPPPADSDGSESKGRG